MNDIIVDKREPKKLRKEFKEEVMKIGDYRIEDFVIERKTISDFIQSYLTGRLKRQLYNMCKVSKRPLLIITGDFFKHYHYLTLKMKRKPITFNTYISMLASLIYLFPNLQILILPNDNALITFLKKLQEKILKHQQISFEKVILSEKKISKNDNFLLRFFMLFDGIGYNKAKLLASHFHSIKEVIEASEKDFMKIKGIGKKQAKQIFEEVRKCF